ncbi:MAG: hypothetical protein DWQ02_05610 [Bacteroidetes bacterium]|nr:MAG: hypothetical protein DWQ02_05610 [Bacteroidota bacterium]
MNFLKIIEPSSVKQRTIWLVTFLCFALIHSNLFAQQLANSNYGLRSKMGVAISQEISNANIDLNGWDGNPLGLTQSATNFQASVPLLLKIEVGSPKVKLSILSAEYTFRFLNNIYSGLPSENQNLLLPENLYANALNISYMHTISFPWMMRHSVRFTYAGDYNGYSPLQINASSFVLYRVNDKLMLGVGALYQQLGSERSFLVVPYMDWRISNRWFLDTTMPYRILVGRNFGSKKQHQLSWGTYIEFFTRYAYQQNNQQCIYENIDISSGLDFRTKIKGKMYLNAFVGSNFLRNINIKDSGLEKIGNISSNMGINARIGLSLNLEDK